MFNSEHVVTIKLLYAVARYHMSGRELSGLKLSSRVVTSRRHRCHDGPANPEVIRCILHTRLLRAVSMPIELYDLLKRIPSRSITSQKIISFISIFLRSNQPTSGRAMLAFVSIYNVSTSECVSYLFHLQGLQTQSFLNVEKKYHAVHTGQSVTCDA